MLSNSRAAYDRLPDRWHRAPRRWGHPLHSIASYMAMFPPAMPHVFIRWLTAPGDAVYDPFSGRGTTPLEACLQGRTGMGSDANPLAALLTKAKVDVPSKRSITSRLTQLRECASDDDTSDVPEHIRNLFAPRTLARLQWLRHELDDRRSVDRFLLTVLAGALHGNANRSGSVRGLTVPMPILVAMGYPAGRPLKPISKPKRRAFDDVVHRERW